MNPALVIAGPTGSGKSSLGMAIASAYPAEIISCDSVQVYRGFDLGAAKPSSVEQSMVPHHLIDRVNWDEAFDANVFGEEARQCVNDISGRDYIPLVIGGTGLYLRAFLQDAWSKDLPTSDELRNRLRQRSSNDLWNFLWRLDSGRAAEVHPNDHYRCMRALEIVLLTGKTFAAATAATKVVSKFQGGKILILPDRKVLDTRIRERTRKMLKDGLVDEVNTLLSSGVSVACKPMQSIGYKQVVQYSKGNFPLSELEDRIVIATRQFAKRQTTWFRSMDFDLQIEEPTLSSQVTHLVESLWHKKAQKT